MYKRDYIYVNLLLSLSNIAVVPCLILQLYKGEYLSFLISSYTAFFSGLYHAFEIKFGLEGVQKILGLSQYVNSKLYVPILLNLDRFFAFSCVHYHFVFFKEQILDNVGVYNIGFSLFLMIVSELFGRFGYIDTFMFTQLFWHLTAYYILFLIYV